MNRIDLRDESGFALAAVIGAVALITVIALSGYFIANNALAESGRVENENRAYQAASSALDQELAVFKTGNLAMGQSSSGYAYGAWQSINGTDDYRVVVNGLGGTEFEMVADGRSPAGASGSTETISVRFQSFNLWDMNISGGEGSGMGSGAGFNGNGTIIGKVYTNGDFDWTGSGSLEEGPIFIRNGVFNKQSSGSNVGFVGDPVDAYFDNPPTGQTSNMFTVSKGAAPRIQIPFPTDADMDIWKQNALNDSAANLIGNNGDVTGIPVPRHPDSSSDSEYNIFDGDVVIGGSSFGKVGVTGMPVNEAVSNDVLAFDAATGTLYINGWVFVDGTVTLTNAVNKYVGKGVFVARDGVVISGRLVPKPFADNVVGSYDLHGSDKMPRVSTNDCIAFMTTGDVTQNVTDWVSAAVFASGQYVAPGTGAKFRGSIIANGIDFSQPNAWLVTQDGMADNLPAGMPELNNVNARSDWIRH